MSIETKQAYSIVEFCQIHSISRAMFYLLLKKDEAPALMKIGRRTLISREAAERWRKRMEQVNAQSN